MAVPEKALPTHLPLPARELVAELRTLKATHRLSLSDIAGKTHYSKASWHRWLRGERLITAQALARFVEITECDGPALHALLAQAVREMSGEAAEAPPLTPRAVHVRAVHVRAVITGMGLGAVTAVLSERLIRSLRRGRS